jgi:hypothetical protein
MLEIARILAGISLISLILVITAAMSPSGREQLRRLDGTAATNDRYLQMTAYLLMATVGLSAVAAVLALTDRLAA